MKLLLIGDSIFGRLDDEDILSLSKLLNGVKIQNSARGGADSADLLKIDFSKNNSANIIAVSIGMNDCNQDVPIDTFVDNLQKFAKNVPMHSILLLLPPPPVDCIRYKSEGKKYNIKLKKYYIAEKTTMSSLPRIKIIDVWDDFIELMILGIDYHQEDGVHLNQLGYEYIFKSISASIG